MKPIVDSPLGLNALEQIAPQPVGDHAFIGIESAEIDGLDEKGRTALGERTKTCQVETLLVDQNSLFREGLKRILAETAYAPSVSAASLDGVQRELEMKDGMRLLILDAVSNHGEACEQVRALKDQNPSVRVVILVEHCELRQMLAAFEAGAAACLMKTTSHEALIKVLDLVMLDETVFPAALLTQIHGQAVLHNQSNLNVLSAREMAVLECLTEGASNKVIARKLDISEATVKVHVKAILRKLKAKNRTQAAIWASSQIVAKQS